MTTPNVPSAAERARAEAARAQADAGVALARFEALTRVRDADRTRVCLLPLGTDPATAAAPRWAEDRAVDLVAAGSAAQPLTPARAEEERRRLLWSAVARIIGAVLAAAVAIGVAVAMISGMAG